MKRALWAIFGVLAIAGLVYYVATHPGLEQVERLESELAKLEAQNDELAGENAALKKEVLALRDDPRLAERRARETAKLARPGEIIYQFEEPEEPIRVEVKLAVSRDDVELAGKTVAVEELPVALEELERQIPGAELAIVFGEDVDAIRRQRIADIVEASPLE